ncbi:Malate dehydrogenase, mitochondrial [Zancudomyces culisetae]|uniref:malate dehydrogenase n=1 Tax=Zancudomyces culisetae TaxID=1213189 RepID=A0A1R1PIN1_ZANCU|nr:Malate dehydrogenase, mitochondrial [Zancudomyces culisetae]OMH80845.1 Malate dehydrogenase, mitochondrial [Zancudomyces culisetae]|eukprot:OMH80798.1 Malate dehydrogenase, mitochondrial [Zancudomyces culisetae]
MIPVKLKERFKKGGIAKRILGLSKKINNKHRFVEEKRIEESIQEEKLRRESSFFVQSPESRNQNPTFSKPEIFNEKYVKLLKDKRVMLYTVENGPIYSTSLLKVMQDDTAFMDRVKKCDRTRREYTNSEKSELMPTEKYNGDGRTQQEEKRQQPQESVTDECSLKMAEAFYRGEEESMFWLDVVDPTDEELEYLETELDLHRLTVESIQEVDFGVDIVSKFPGYMFAAFNILEEGDNTGTQCAEYFSSRCSFILKGGGILTFRQTETIIQRDDLILELKRLQQFGYQHTISPEYILHKHIMTMVENVLMYMNIIEKLSFGFNDYALSSASEKDVKKTILYLRRGITLGLRNLLSKPRVLRLLIRELEKRRIGDLPRVEKALGLTNVVQGKPILGAWNLATSLESALSQMNIMLISCIHFESMASQSYAHYLELQTVNAVEDERASSEFLYKITAFTCVFSVSTAISGLFGMNVDVPFKVDNEDPLSILFNKNSSKGANVTVLGAAGGIGQPLSLLLKTNPLVSRLNLYDVVNSVGVAADVSHINHESEVAGFLPENDGLKKSLDGADVVLIPAGVPRKPGMTRDDLFNTNAGIVKTLTTACAEVCPNAKILIISNPVNSTVPIASEVYKKHGVDGSKKIFGVTTLDLVRASRFVYEKLGKIVNVPVIGGHAGTTIIPLFSQVEGLKLSKEELEALTYRVQFGGDEVVKAKAGTGSATLSMAFAGARFADSVIRGSNGEEIVECAFVRTDLYKSEGIDYFSTFVKLGPNGVETILPIPKDITAYEKGLIAEGIKQLQASEKKGVEFASKQ